MCVCVCVCVMSCLERSLKEDPRWVVLVLSSPGVYNYHKNLTTSHRKRLFPAFSNVETDVFRY